MRPHRGAWTGAALLTISAMVMGAASARAETVEVYAAGSLTPLVQALTTAMAPLDVQVRPTFGPAGSLRARIEAGETADLFLSADMAAPRKLADEGRAILPAVAFAQNRMCLVFRRPLGVTPDTLVERMLAKGNRLKTSTPVVDPGGDYAAAIFDRIDAAHGGAGAWLRDEAAATEKAARSAQPLPGHSAAASLFLTHQIDMTIVYCSVAPAIVQEAPETASLPFPPALEPQPINGLAVLTAKPAALRLALYLLSDKGQALVKAADLLPLVTPSHP